MSNTRRVAIMQPYFLPYIGYWQLINNCDYFVIYDNIEYTKKGWINRNRFLLNGKDETFSLPLKKASDHLYVHQRVLADDFEMDKLHRKWRAAYRKAPKFDEGMALIEQATISPDRNLFNFILHSITSIHRQLGMGSQIIISSNIDIDHSLKSQDKVLAICQALNASEYINPIGGTSLYTKEAFSEKGIRLHFQQVRPYQYSQFGNNFVPHLSIIDPIMFLGINNTRKLLQEMDLC